MKIFVCWRWISLWIVDVWKRIEFKKSHRKSSLIWRNSVVCKSNFSRLGDWWKQIFFCRDISNNLISTIYPDSFAGLKSLNSLYVYRRESFFWSNSSLVFSIEIIWKISHRKCSVNWTLFSFCECQDDDEREIGWMRKGMFQIFTYRIYSPVMVEAFFCFAWATDFRFSFLPFSLSSLAWIF